MVILTLLHPQHRTPLRQWCFPNEPLIRIGRAPGNHVILNDLLVSRHHLDLRQVDVSTADARSAGTVSWHLVNHSSNGTFVNGAVMSQGLLGANALLQLAQGGPLLKLQILAATGSVSKSPLAIAKAPQLPALPQPPLLVKQPLRLFCNHAGNPPDNLFCMHCGLPVKVEKTIRQYQVLRVLGKGGMGTTYLVWHPAASQVSGQPQNALRVLKEMNADMAKIPKAQELFEREASTLQTLSHPGIPKFYDFFVEAGKKYLVMALLHGQDLEKRIRHQGPVSAQQAIAWMIQTCDILSYLHTHRTPIIHRDIKPGNLLVQTLTNSIVVLDFGAVKAVGIPSGTRIGAEGYAAPEQAQGRPVTQSDLYAIGPSLIFLITGQNPVRLYTKGNQSYRFSLDNYPEITPPLRKVIDRVTQSRASDRYQTAKELMQALSNCL
ncbi:protein kinase domain-containing protein [Stenomitos frigidus]|uniref:Serine/threonine protein kinase n=1 Tax=Stenomitos frigidus ULC18 TaxID=2107698 RepID=A0A2T1DVT1_9CYAN|nr:protein kinase [Stenomitos frigidus]PSB24597.1 serine/threonine protein kinase [Stenomitos frigidus ULC18]